MYNNIENPITGLKVNINTNAGKKIIKNYNQTKHANLFNF
jgi:hypothetical protein